jgi:hypothetical protein
MWVDLQSFVTGFNDAIGMITLVVGLVAVYLYLKQKSDQKRDAASLIVQEIRYAEQRISDHRKFNAYKFYDQLLPTSHWYANINLFVAELKESEIDLISKFYSQAAYVDGLIKHLANLAASALIPRNTPSSPSPAPTSSSPEPSAQVALAEFDSQAKLLLDQVSKNIEFIYNTPAIDKLRKISEKRWYHIF